VRREHIRLHNPQYSTKNHKHLREQQEWQQQYQTGIHSIETQTTKGEFGKQWPSSHNDIMKNVKELQVPLQTTLQNTQFC